MRREFHPEARVEYLEAITYYEERQTGLGAQFVAEIERTIQRIVENPTLWVKVEGDIKRCLTHTFPYGVFYTVEADGVFLLAVMHLSRKPGYWSDRLQRA